MVPVSTLSATAEVFVGHRYGLWNKTRGSRSASWRDLYCESAGLTTLHTADKWSRYRKASSHGRCHSSPGRNCPVSLTDLPPHLPICDIHLEQLRGQRNRSAHVEVHRLVLRDRLRALYSSSDRSRGNPTDPLPGQLPLVEHSFTSCPGLSRSSMLPSSQAMNGSIVK